MRLRSVLRRFFLPGPVVSAVCYLRYGARVSPRAEVELSGNLMLARGVTIGSFVKVKTSGGPLKVGEWVQIGAGAYISAQAGGITIGRDSLIGPNVCIMSANYVYDRLDVPMREQGHTSRGVTIGEDVWVGAGTVILDGAEIGSGSIVNANAVVSGRIPERSVVAGNPGRVVFTRRP